MNKQKKGGFCAAWRRAWNYWRTNFSVRLAAITIIVMFLVAVAFQQYLQNQYLQFLVASSSQSDRMVLDVEADVIERRASDTSRGGVTLRRQLSRETAQQVKTMLAEYAAAGDRALSGVYLEEESKRYYPMGAFASQLIGLTTIDGEGQAGLEQALNRFLSGRAGRVLEDDRKSVV